MVEELYDSNLVVLCTGAFILIAGAAGFGSWIGRRSGGAAIGGADIGTLAGAALGLLALLLAFSFSLALSRYDVRRSQVLEEANAIGSTANFALMLTPLSGSALVSLSIYLSLSGMLPNR